MDRIEVRGLCQETPWSHERGRDGMWRESGGEQVRRKRKRKRKGSRKSGKGWREKK